MPKLDAAQRRALKGMVEHGPIPAVYGVVRWRLKAFAQWLFDEFGVSVDETTVDREIRAFRLRKRLRPPPTALRTKPN
ncbi:winged helix-turn-helix domain-containing protein [Caenispirillum salinarum]|uniref:winged helix-turn-helix domain-containing protein n=1 Tax=Caenispirillum salinarum TaxID=859058 RepID=UPI002287494C|nr:winged helix-turn-helix domain-containing protein [Caenispirillum salinarum]